MTSKLVTTDVTCDQALSDEVVVERLRAGETDLFEVLIRRLNRRLYQVIRRILGDDSEVEDVMQNTYVVAYSCLHQFSARAKPSTWITRIAINLAYAHAQHLRYSQRFVMKSHTQSLRCDAQDPEQLASVRELAKLLEQAVDSLPEVYRNVFVKREVEELDTSETAALLRLSEQSVRVRLHRAKVMLRIALQTAAQTFLLHKPRCNDVVLAVRAEGPSIGPRRRHSRKPSATLAAVILLL